MFDWFDSFEEESFASFTGDIALDMLDLLGKVLDVLEPLGMILDVLE